MSKVKYLEYIRASAQAGEQSYEKNVSDWLGSFKPEAARGYAGHIYSAMQTCLEGFLYNVCKDEAYAHKARKYLLSADIAEELVSPEMVEGRPEFEKGIPYMDTCFALPYYMHGYLNIKDSGALNEQEDNKVKRIIKNTIYSLLHYPEWGAHNRSMLRVWSLSLAAEAIGRNAETDEWMKLADYLAEESIGRWSIEDAAHYIPLWLFSCVEYMRIIGREKEYYSMPLTRYYFEYLARLVNPEGTIVDFGDAHVNSYWYLWLPLLEKGAAVYQSPEMKYVAEKIYDFGMHFVNNKPEPGIAMCFTFAYKWADDELKPKVPDWKSELVLEELAGKKISFRNGCSEGSTYLLLNYRDEGPYSHIPRRYLRTTIDVKAEKMHHGHSDENSVVMLAKGGNILLNDGGYRENLPNGKYRADIYHNRLVFRSGLKQDSEGMYDFIHDNGHYKYVETELIHFQSFDELDVSRTRMHYLPLDLTWDRIITYLKEEEAFIFVDWVKSEKDQDITIGNLWHAGSVLNRSCCAYDVAIPQIFRGPGDKTPYINRDDLSLLVEFTGSANHGCENIKRGYGDSVMVYSCEASAMQRGAMSCIITVLTPHERSRNTDDIKGRLNIKWLSEAKDFLSLTYSGSKQVNLAYKLDLEYGILDEEYLPRYTYLSGLVDYHGIETDADFSFVIEGKEKLRYGFINGCGIRFEGRELYKTPWFSSYHFSKAVWEVKEHKWKAWDGTAAKPVSILLVGIGGYGNLYSEALLDNEDGDKFYIAGIVDPRPENSRNYERLLAKKIPIFNTIEEFYEKMKADLAIISSPIHFHSQQTCYALSYGSSVLCEKPISASPEDAIKMINARNEAGKLLMIGYQWSHCETILKAKQDILSGKYGKAVRLKTLVLWPRDENYYSRGWAGRITDGKGNLVNDSVANNATAHYLNNMFFILGNSLDSATKPSFVQAELYRANKIENFDTAAVRIYTEDGIELLFIVAHPTFTNKGPCFEYEFENGTISFELSKEAGAGQVKGFLKDGTVIEYGNPNSNEMGKLWAAIAAMSGDCNVTSPAEAALPQIYCIAAMQQSVPDIAEFPKELIKTTGHPILTYVEGLDRALLNCYQDWKLPSECGINWAIAGRKIKVDKF